jgi:prophage regulatory protein
MNTTVTHRILRLPQMETITGYKRSSIYARMDKNAKQFDPDFPKPISLSSTGKGSVGWLESEVMTWIEHRITVSRQQQ